MFVMNSLVADALLCRLIAELGSSVEIIENLHRAGYEGNFDLVNGCLKCKQTGVFFQLSDLQVDEIYRFSDSDVVLGGYYIYAIHDRWSGFKGLFTASISDGDRFLPTK
jgi:hypothetical protein